MEKFIKERLHEVNLEKGRAKATEEEITRSAKKGVPDAAGPSSLMASRAVEFDCGGHFRAQPGREVLEGIS